MEASIGAVIMEGRSIFVAYIGLERPANTTTWLFLVCRKAWALTGPCWLWGRSYLRCLNKQTAGGCSFLIANRFSHGKYLSKVKELSKMEWICGVKNSGRTLQNFGAGKQWLAVWILQPNCPGLHLGSASHKLWDCGRITRPLACALSVKRGNISTCLLGL